MKLYFKRNLIQIVIGKSKTYHYPMLSFSIFDEEHYRFIQVEIYKIKQVWRLYVCWIYLDRQSKVAFREDTIYCSPILLTMPIHWKLTQDAILRYKEELT